MAGLGVVGPWCVGFKEDAHVTPHGPLRYGHGRGAGGRWGVVNRVLHTLHTLHTFF